MPSPEDEIPNIDWLIAVFTSYKRDDGDPDPTIKLWVQPVGALKDLMRNICNIKGALLFCTYC